MLLTQNRRIQKWLRSRQTLIVALQQLCFHRPFWKTESLMLVSSVQEFCQQLIDYTSLGHFEIYEHIQSPLLHSIFQTTLRILDFNDRYQTSLDPIQFERDLSFIAENLAYRFEWEDDLIKEINLSAA